MSVFGPVAADLERLEGVLAESLATDPDLAADPMRRLVGAGGKRLRPALVLLAGCFGNYDFDRLAPAAVAVELCHSATLVHDDLIDRSPVRRGRPTVAAQEGAAMAILVADYYFARSYHEASRTGVAQAVAILARAVMDICTGELDQEAARFRFSTTPAEYERRIGRKTASLIAAALEMGAVVAGVPPIDRAALREYGRHLGMAFQIADDVLDFTGTEVEMGKPVGHDIAEGSWTLPVMLAATDPAISAQISELVREGEPPAPAVVGEIVRLTIEAGACEAAMARARGHAELGIAALAALPGSAARAALEGVAAYVLERSR